VTLTSDYQPGLRMCDIKLTYFYGKGRAEISRLILAFAGAEYEDNRITYEEFQDLKPYLSYSQVPRLEYKGDVIYQSRAIARFLANEFGLAGRNNTEKAQADEVVDAVVDLQNAAYTVFFEKDEKVKAEKTKKVFGETLPTGLKNLEKCLVRRGGKHFVGSDFTWADLSLVMLVDFLANQNDNILESLPKLSALVERTKAVPNIKKWLKERPADGLFVKLTYFNLRGRAESARLVLAYAGTRYQDNRITGEEFSLIKPSLCYGQLPKLEYKGHTVYQSVSIARFLATEFGIAGRTNVEKAQVNEVVDAINDLHTAVVSAILFEKDEKAKEEKKKKLYSETIPSGLKSLETMLVKRGGQYFVGNSFSWAELHFMQFVDLIVSQDSKVLESSPALANNVQRTRDLPNIRKWLNERPANDF